MCVLSLGVCIVRKDLEKLVAKTFLTVLMSIALFAAGSFADAQEETLRLLNRNATLEDGVSGWFDSGLHGQSVSRENVFQYSNDRSRLELGQKLARLQGSGTWGQYLTLTPNSRYHILNAFAFKQASKPGTAAGFACVAVTYYDVAGVELDQVLIEIEVARFSPTSGTSDGLNFYDWGIQVPTGAAFAYLFAYSSPGTDVYIDNLGLFELTKAISSPSLATNLVVNPSFLESRVATSDAGPVTCFGYGTEFWESNIDWLDGFNQAFGSPNQSEWAYQVIPITATRTYSLIASGDKFEMANTPASVIIDFYDANWKAVGKTVVNTPNAETFDFLGRRVQPPATAAFASVVIFCDPLPAGPTPLVGGMRVDLQFYEQETRATAGPSAIATRTSVFGISTADQTGVVTVLYSDPDGVDLNSIGIQDAYFVSKTNATKNYPVTRIQSFSMDNNKLVTVNYYSTLGATVVSDLGDFVVRGSQVKDTKGNNNVAKRFNALKFTLLR